VTALTRTFLVYFAVVLALIGNVAYGQGYYFHHPLPLDSFLALKKNRYSKAAANGSDSKATLYQKTRP